MRGPSASAAQPSKSGFNPSEQALGSWAASADGGLSRLSQEERTALLQTCEGFLVVLNCFFWRPVTACPALQKGTNPYQCGLQVAVLWVQLQW